jgi:outer membrane protein assembly factor BamA
MWFLCTASPALAGQDAPDGASRQAADRDTASPAQAGDASVAEESRPCTFKARLLPFGSDKERHCGSDFAVIAGVIVSGSGLAGGANYRYFNLLDSPIDAQLRGMFSVRGYQDYRLSVGLLDARNSTLELNAADARISSLFNTSSRKAPGSALYVEMRYRDYPKHTFYGPGNRAIEDNRTDYALRGVSAEGVWQRQFSSRFGVSARTGVLALHIGQGQDDSIVDFEQRFVPATIPGALEQPRFVTAGVGFEDDTRSDPRIPEDGRLIAASVRTFRADRPNLSFTRFTAEVRTYRRAFSPRVVFATRLVFAGDFSASASSTPFYVRQSLGGTDTLRGFDSYRFADRTLAHATAMIRYRANRYMEIIPFYDIGTTANGVSKLDFGARRTSPGIGIRARTDKQILADFAYAWSTEGGRVVFTIGAAL